MAGNLNIKNANGKTLTIQNPDTNNADIVIDGSKIASTVSPALTGNPTAPTQAAQDNSTKVATTAYVDGKMVLSTAVNSTSGTSIDFTGVPSWARRITVMFNGVSTNGGSTTVVRLGTSNSIESNGYAGVCANIGSTATTYSNLSSGFETLQLGAASIVQQGQLILSNISGNTWVASSMMGRSDNNFFGLLAGSKTLAGVLDRVRITTANGVDSFDAGQINIMYEG